MRMLTGDFNPNPKWLMKPNGEFNGSLPGQGAAKIKYDKGQLGRKIKKHGKEWGLDPSENKDRLEFRRITKDIVDNHTQSVKGKWMGQPEECTFYIKGKDVVIVNSEGVYVTTMKDGVNNRRVREAIKNDNRRKGR